MAIIIRMTGWGLFAAGGLVFILNGGFTNIRQPINMIAMLLMPIGMILTGVSNLVDHFVKLRRRREHDDEDEESREPEAPQKQYKLRELRSPEGGSADQDAGESTPPDAAAPAPSREESSS